MAWAVVRSPHCFSEFCSHAIQGLREGEFFKEELFEFGDRELELLGELGGVTEAGFGASEDFGFGAAVGAFFFEGGLEVCEEFAAHAEFSVGGGVEGADDAFDVDHQ